MKKFLFYLSIFCLTVFSCDRSTGTESITTEKNNDNNGQKDPEPPKKDEAYIDVTATGRDSYSNIEIWVGTKESNIFVQEEMKVLPANGKVKIDVSKYIGRTFIVQAVEKSGNKTIEHTGVQVTIERNKTHSITLNIPIIQKKTYNANIQVNKAGRPQANIKVYAVPYLQQALLDQISLLGSKIFENINGITMIATDANGIAKFTNLPESIGGNYKFVIITKEAEVLPRVEGRYIDISLKMDGINTQSGTINIPTTSLKVSVITSKNIDNTTVNLYKGINTTSPTYTTNIRNGKIELTEIEAGEYSIKSTSQECVSFLPNSITVKADTNNEQTIIAYTGGTLTLKNNSSNSYNVNIKYADGKEEKIVMNGKTTKELRGAIGDAKINVEQREGYILYPTKENLSAKLACGKTSSICFPSDRCN